MIVAGIGRRAAPADALERCQRVGELCRELGLWLRTGHAEGADYAFECGARERSILYLPAPHFGLKSRPLKSPHIVSLPGRGFKGTWRRPDSAAVQRAEQNLKKYHPFSDKLEGFSKLLQVRNDFIIFGAKATVKAVDLVLYWAKPNARGQVTGGTGQALRLAQGHGIPCLNLDELSVDQVAARLRARLR